MYVQISKDKAKDQENGGPIVANGCEAEFLVIIAEYFP